MKIPPTTTGFQLAAEIASTYKTCITAIFSPAQALVAREDRASYIAVYVNRATRWMGDGLGLTRAIAEVLSGSHTAVLAASLKSVDDVIAAVNAGAQHVTLPFDILNTLVKSEHSTNAVAAFTKSGSFL